MKLKNKKTGEIGYLYANKNENYNVLDENDKVLAVYETLEAVVEEWCDYEEPKEYWYIDEFGLVQKETEYYYEENKEAVHDKRIAIGNYFESKEEAERVVEKLKAWHKLMDYWETEVLGWEIRDMPTGGNWQTVNVKFNVKTRKEPVELLDILFGGEE